MNYFNLAFVVGLGIVAVGCILVVAIWRCAICKKIHFFKLPGFSGFFSRQSICRMCVEEYENVHGKKSIFMRYL